MPVTQGLRVKQTGEPLIKDIVMTEEEFQGPLSHLLPDVLLMWHPDAPATEICSTNWERLTLRSKLAAGETTRATVSRFLLERLAILAGFRRFLTSATTGNF